MNGPIVLLTDFGSADPYVGVMKGVILQSAPSAAIVDLCHEVPPQDVRTAALFLRASVPYFPKGSLFVCVVDPGVGGARQILWARTARHQFLAPDNGLLSWIEEPILERRRVANRKLWADRISSTFHGRDIIAPVAGRLARGLAPARLGPAASKTASLPWPSPRRARGRLRGELLWIDRFGNAVTNLRAGDVGARRSVVFRGRSLGPLRTHYAEGRDGTALALVGSSGFVELSVRNGDFAKRYRASLGDPVESTR